MRTRLRVLLEIALLGGLVAGPVVAATTPYTDPAAFQAAATTGLATRDFDGLVSHLHRVADTG